METTAIKFASQWLLMWNVERISPPAWKVPMFTDIAAVVASIAAVAGLCWALHGWFRWSINRFNSVAAKDVLAAWDAKLAKVSADDRERLRAQPPVAVLEALIALPSQRSRRFQLSYIR
jgi:hypothetical protein